MKREFNKLTNGSLHEEDFHGGVLGFLLMAADDLTAPQGVSLSARMGPVVACRATYEGLKKLDADPKVYTIEHSRPVYGGYDN